jgi:antitoxin MazE
MKATIQKWGNSLGIRIPSYIAKDLSLEQGSSVEIIEEDRRIIIQPRNRKKLSDILESITEENIHTEQFDIRAGNEVL